MTEEAPRTADVRAAGDDEHVVDAVRLGQRLGRYQLVLPLAKGGMGVVFAGRLVGPHGVERLVAIKTLRPITSASDRAALLSEAKLTSRLHHRNVVATLDLGEVDDVPYVVMELVDGVPLSRLTAELAKKDERLSPALAAWIVMQAAQGLHAAHELEDADGKPLGLVHRDVSPQNILLSLQGEVKIADFGIAKFLGREESTATGMIKGKFAYMSPEQAGSGELDRRSDIFALGIVLWESLTALRLFAADTPARTMLRVLEHRPLSPIEHRPEVGAELAAITMKCLAHDPGDRFPTAAALVDALRVAIRALPAPVDEGDLSTLVTRVFGAERTKTMDRIRSEAPIQETTTQPFIPGEASGIAVSAAAQPASKRGTSRRRAVQLAAVVAAVVGVAATVGVVWSLPRGELPAPANATATPNAPAAPATSSAPRAADPPIPVPAPSPIASASAPRPSPPPIAPPTRRPDAPRPKATASARPSAPPSAPPKPTVGQPFESL